MQGQVFGRFRISAKIGEGGMAHVWAAQHEISGRQAVVKLLLPEMRRHPQIVKRFLQEAKAAARIDDPGIVKVIDVGHTEDGRAFLVLERLYGEPLSKRLEGEVRLSPEQATNLIKQLYRTLAAAHAHGIVHRDLKPDNLFIVKDPEVPGGERVKVLDFGLAKLLQESNSIYTAEGSLFGTPKYMAPEQCIDPATVDHRADLYAVGCIFYHLVCGVPPFSGRTVNVLNAQLNTRPMPPAQRTPTVPSELSALIMRLLEKAPDARIQSCEQVLSELEACTGAVGSSSGIPIPVFDDLTVPSPESAGAMTERDEATLVCMPRAPVPLNTRRPVVAQRVAPASPHLDPRAPRHRHAPSEVATRPIATRGPMTHARPSDRMESAFSPDIDRRPEVSSTSLARAEMKPMAQRGRRTWRYWLLAGVAAALLWSLWRVLPAHEGTSDTRPDEASASDEAGEPPVVARPSVQSPQEKEHEQDSVADPLLERAEEAASEGQWEIAGIRVSRALHAVGDPPPERMASRVRELQERIAAGAADKKRFNDLQELAESIEEAPDNIDRFVEHHASLPDTSWYREQAERLYRETRDAWMANVDQRAGALLRQGKCKMLSELVQRQRDLFDQVSDASSRGAEDCERLTRERRERQEQLPKDIENARDEGKRLRLCRQLWAPVNDGGHTALRCGMAACRGHDRKQARRFARQLNKSSRNPIKQACIARDIEI